MRSYFDKLGIRGLGRAVAAGALIWISTLWAPASAQSSRCFGNGDVVTFDGVASAGPSPSEWLLNLSFPICVALTPSSPGIKVFTLRIIGMPPPLGIPLELTGKLLLKHSVAAPTMFVALVVKRGRKLRMLENASHAPEIVPTPGQAPRTAPAPEIAPVPPIAPVPRITPVLRSATAPEVASGPRTGAENCNVPPYGGTPVAYHSFVRRFGRIVKPEKILADVCNAKFGNSPRDGLHRLGLTDAKIDSENTEQVAADMIVALKNFVDKLQ